jgi:predicted metalloprotease
MTDDGTAPKPGHFLPGGAGDGTAEQVRPVVRPPEPERPGVVRGHSQQQTFGWVEPTAGRHAIPTPPPYERRRPTRPVLAALVAVSLLAAGGGVAAVAHLMRPYDGLVDRPLTQPTLPPSGSSDSAAPQATVTVTATPTPDTVIVKQNDFYKTGRLVPSKCDEPSYRPSTKTGVARYVQAMLPCLNKSWAPSVRKAGHEFRAPKIVLFKGDDPVTPCSGQTSDAFYCGTNETIYLSWTDEVEQYAESDHTWARIDLAATVAHEYGHHVQQLVGILDASQSMEDGAPTGAAQLLESRRVELQAECLSAVYLGADADWFPVDGRIYDKWLWRAKHHGDEYSEDHVRDHGSRKSTAAWSVRGFENPDPKSCNTFTASASKVS